jgi:hypothetical protein
MAELNKKSDESWKLATEKEKEQLKGQGKFVAPEPDFSFFVSTLALQASIALGAVPEPATNQKQENLPQAKFIIDTLALLQEKTKGNLKEEETGLLENLLYELRMQYVSRIKEIL